jgi:hypothetical protein
VCSPASAARDFQESGKTDHMRPSGATTYKKTGRREALWQTINTQQKNREDGLKVKLKALNV